MKMEILSENSDGSRANGAQTGVRVSQQAATPQQPTVLFTSPQQILPSSPPHEQVVSQGGNIRASASPAAATRVRKNNLIIQGTQTFALPQANGNMILHVQLPQNPQSVIQPATHASGAQSTTSVIQATSAGAIQNFKSPLILLKKNSVIQSAGQQLAEEVQLVQGGIIGGNLTDGKDRRDGERRTAYRTYSDLSMQQQDAHDMGTMQTELPQQYVQYGTDSQIFVPVSTVPEIAYQLRPAPGSSGGTPVVVSATGLQQTNHVLGTAEETARKRELRLQKNREAAKECRKKKKDYIKCLEERVNILEGQNTNLITELEKLKELYFKVPKES